MQPIRATKRWSRTYTMLIGLVLLALPGWAVAIDFRSGTDVVIASGTVVDDDLYVAAATLTIDGTVTGDVIAAARTITINGTVEGDLFAAAQTVTINGAVGDDARITGSALQLGPDATVADDLLASGASLVTDGGSVVGGTLTFGGQQALLAGSVAEDVNFGGGAVELRGDIGGDFFAGVSSGTPGGFPTGAFPGMPALPSIPTGLTLASDSKVGGNLEYSASNEFNIPAGAVGGEVVYNPPDVQASTRRSFRPASLVRRYIALVLVGLLLVLVWPAFFRRAAERLRDRPWVGLGVGALTLVGFPLAILILLAVVILVAILLGLITLGGLGGAVVVIGGAIVVSLGALFFLVLTYLTQVVVALVGGRWLLARLGSSQDNPLGPLLLGLLLVVVLTGIPVLGFWVTLAIVLFGLGALWFAWMGRGRQVATPS